MMQPKDRDSLNALIEFHERTWGTKHYRGRPSLSAILSSPVVIFWRANDGKEARWMITLHADLKEVERYFSRLLFRSSVEPPARRVVRIFNHGKPVIVRGVKVWFQEVEG